MKFEIGRLTVNVSGAHPVVVTWQGESDAQNPAQLLKPVMDALLDVGKDRSVCMRFAGLEYMNSATVKPIMIMLERLSQTARSIQVEYREEVQWQATSFRAMRIVAKRKWKNVQITGR